MSVTDLRKITDEALTAALASLVRHERAVTIDVLHHLNEVERRKLHLNLGFSSLFSYCTKRLGYSESAAGRRIQTARCIRRFPQVVTLLERGEVNLSTVCKVAGAALSRNEPALFERIRGRTLDEVDAIVAEQRPAARIRDGVRLVRVAAPKPDETNPERVPLGATMEREREAATHPANDIPSSDDACHSIDDTTTDPPHQRRESVPVEQKYRVQFVAGPELLRALEQVRSLLSFRLPANASMESVFAIVLDDFIERHSPDRRRARRTRARPQNGGGRSVGKRGVGGRKAGNGGTSDPRPGRRHVPAAVRDDVMTRDGHRCTYSGRDGKQCGSTRYLQIDHIHPVALGGRSDPRNLRVLCGAHNRLEAERIMGGEAIARHAVAGSLPLRE